MLLPQTWNFCCYLLCPSLEICKPYVEMHCLQSPTHLMRSKQFINKVLKLFIGGPISLAAAIGLISDYRHLYGWQETMIQVPPRAPVLFSGSEGDTAPCQVTGKRPHDMFAWISNYNLFPKDWRVFSQKIKSKNLYISLPQKNSVLAGKILPSLVNVWDRTSSVHSPLVPDQFFHHN